MAGTRIRRRVAMVVVFVLAAVAIVGWLAHERARDKVPRTLGEYVEQDGARVWEIEYVASGPDAVFVGARLNKYVSPVLFERIVGEMYRCPRVEAKRTGTWNFATTSWTFKTCHPTPRIAHVRRIDGDVMGDDPPYFVDLETGAWFKGDTREWRSITAKLGRLVESHMEQPPTEPRAGQSAPTGKIER